jgi:hypothetical protein
MMSFGSLQVSQNTEVDARVNSDSTLDSTGFLDIDDLNPFSAEHTKNQYH